MPIAESNSYIVLRTGSIMTAEGLTFKDYSLVVKERGRYLESGGSKICIR